jgi:hypothetical protein
MEMLARILDRGNQIEIVSQLGCVGQKHVQAAFSSLYAKRWPDQLQRCFGCARESGERIGHWVFGEEIHASGRG